MSKKILIIDDDLHSLGLVEATLKREGYQVATACSGLEGLSRIQTERPCLVILDVLMPGMDGFEVCRRIRRSPEMMDLPLIMLSAKSGLDDRVLGFMLGADDYIPKPAAPAEIAARVHAVLVRVKRASNLKSRAMLRVQ